MESKLYRRRCLVALVPFFHIITLFLLSFTHLLLVLFVASSPLLSFLSTSSHDTLPLSFHRDNLNTLQVSSGRISYYVFFLYLPPFLPFSLYFDPIIFIGKVKFNILLSPPLLLLPGESFRWGFFKGMSRKWR